MRNSNRGRRLSLDSLMQLLYEKGSESDVLRISALTWKYQMGREQNPFMAIIRAISESNRTKHYLAYGYTVGSFGQLERLASLTPTLIYHRPSMIFTLFDSRPWRILNAAVSKSVISKGEFLRFRNYAYRSLTLAFVRKAFCFLNLDGIAAETAFLASFDQDMVEIGLAEQLLSKIKEIPINAFHQSFAGQVSFFAINIWKVRKVLERASPN